MAKELLSNQLPLNLEILAGGPNCIIYYILKIPLTRLDKDTPTDEQT